MQSIKWSESAMPFKIKADIGEDLTRPQQFYQEILETETSLKIALKVTDQE